MINELQRRMAEINGISTIQVRGDMCACVIYDVSVRSVAEGIGQTAAEAIKNALDNLGN